MKIFRAAPYLLALALMTAGPASSQQAMPTAAEPPAVPAATGTTPPSGAASGWSVNVSPSTSEQTPGSDPAAGPQQGQERLQINLTPEQIDLVNRLSAYFNSLQHLEGQFIQINPNSETTRGRFYVQRPGLLRFDYAAPSKLRVVADGRYLSIEDHDLRTVDQYPLEATPFRLLLSEDVDLLRDAEIVDLSVNGNIASLTLVDRSENARGRLQLFFTTDEIELKEWVITDPQGLDTRIQLSHLVQGNEKSRDFFKSSALDFQSFSQQ
ncbi:MAG: outer membrane lipoprotein carrier protein LolA [Alphaproteobacteria bacterium]|nr:MAG: outer membrane lipoprotein carrier protein LolA [Alphaproteobacteria bacterium]